MPVAIGSSEYVICPKCGTELKLSNKERSEGAVIECPHCNYKAENSLFNKKSEVIVVDTKKSILPLILFLFICGICSSFGYGMLSFNNENTSSGLSTYNPTQTQKNTGTPTPLPTNPADMKFSGKGRKTTQKFKLQEGLAIITASHSGSSNFIVHLKDLDSGKDVESITNEIGKGTWETAFQAEPNTEYVLTINADGNWSMVLKQPLYPTNTNTFPITLQDKGSRVKAIQLPEGVLHVRGTHKGSSNFIVHLYDTEGDYEGIVNEIGNYDFDDYITIPENGVYFLQVMADGTWTFTFESK